MNPAPECQYQIDIVSALSEIIRKFERYNSAIETKNTYVSKIDSKTQKKTQIENITTKIKLRPDFLIVSRRKLLRRYPSYKKD